MKLDLVCELGPTGRSRYVALASPCQHQACGLPSKGKLTPFRSRYRKPFNFQMADYPLG